MAECKLHLPNGDELFVNDRSVVAVVLAPGSNQMSLDTGLTIQISETPEAAAAIVQTLTGASGGLRYNPNQVLAAVDEAGGKRLRLHLRGGLNAQLDGTNYATFKSAMAEANKQRAALGKSAYDWKGFDG